MPRFRYRALDGARQRVEGELEAESRSAAMLRLREQRLLPLEARELGGSPLRDLLQRDLGELLPVSQAQVARGLGNLAALLQAGLPLERALRVLLEGGQEPRLRRAFAEVLARLGRGSRFSDALAGVPGVFSAEVVAVARAGEHGGTLAPSLERLAATLERGARLRQQVRSALIYPAILLVATLLTVVLLLTVVVPEFEPIFGEAGRQLPLATRIVVGAGDLAADWWWSLPLLLLLVPLLLRSWLAAPRRRIAWHGFLLRLWLLGGLLRRIEMARFARTLGTLLQNGVGLTGSLGLAGGGCRNAAVAAAVGRAEAGVRAGEALAACLRREAVFPPLTVQMVQVGQETGRLGDMLLRLAELYDQEIGLQLERVLALLVPLLTVVLGLIVGFVLFAILSAVLSINEVVF